MTLRSRITAAERRLDASPHETPPEFAALLMARYGAPDLIAARQLLAGEHVEGSSVTLADLDAARQLLEAHYGPGDGEAEDARLARIHEVLRRDRGL
jgi:hypothetical protein